VRSENGHEEPYGVTRFELGNEFSDSGQNYWMSGASQENKGTVDLYIEGDVMTISGQRSYYQTNNRVAKKGDWRPRRLLVTAVQMKNAMCIIFRLWRTARKSLWQEQSGKL